MQMLARATLAFFLTSFKLHSSCCCSIQHKFFRINTAQQNINSERYTLNFLSCKKLLSDGVSGLNNCRVLPTSSEDGLIECVPSVALARVLAEHKTINRFFAISNADPTGRFPLPQRNLASTSFRKFLFRLASCRSNDAAQILGLYLYTIMRNSWEND